jgi:deazaflavin-dependent oxidoreductase (nitroreductase family)
LVSALAVGALAVTIGIARRRAAHPRPEVVAGAPLRRLRGFVVRIWNPIVLRLGLAGGARSPWGLIEHVGRTSGHVYRTPVSPRAIEGGYELPLPYGTDVHWLRNVLAAGQARIQHHDTIFELDRPEVVEARDAMSVPAAIRATAQRHGYHYLRLHTVAEMTGDFAHGEGHRAALSYGETFPMSAEGAFGATFLAPAGVEVPIEPQMVERAASEGEESPTS